MNTHLKQLWAAMKLPEKLQKKLYFFCRGLDIRVAKRMKIQIGKMTFLQALAVSFLNRARLHAVSGSGQYETVGMLRLGAEQFCQK